MGKLTISMAMFNSYVKLPKGSKAYVSGNIPTKIWPFYGTVPQVLVPEWAIDCK